MSTHAIRAEGVRVRTTKTFVAFYDLSMTIAQHRGLGSLRREVVGRARGVTLELGAGTGLNLAHYPTSVENLVLTEPDPNMIERLERRVAAAERAIEIIEAPAERLPVEDGSIDTVVSTLVFCTAAHPRAALTEVARILRPGGRLLFIEHVRSSNRLLAGAQDLLERPWFWFAGGCHCNRDTLATLRSSVLDVRDVRRERLYGLTPLVRPLIVGSAVRL